MPTTYNIYCDESCHLEKDQQKIMVLGAVWCPQEKVREAIKRIREIKLRHGLSKDFEIKWTKVSPAKVQFYLDVLDYFFDDDDLHCRALIVPDKSKLRHDLFGQTHDSWYYKMYFVMLKIILEPTEHYQIYLDIKDTRSAGKAAKLHDVLANNIHDFERRIIRKVQVVRSHEIELIQLADLLIGAVSYVNRGLSGSAAKMHLVEEMQLRSHYRLTRTTAESEQKVNLFRWHALGKYA